MLLLTSPYCHPRLDELKARHNIWIDEVLDDIDTYIYDAPNVFFKVLVWHISRQGFNFILSRSSIGGKW